MSEKEIKLFVVFLQRLEDLIGTDRLDRLLGYTIGTFNKLYDREEERDNIIEDITKYINGEARYIDDGYEETKKIDEEQRKYRKEQNEVISNLGKIIHFFTKNPSCSPQ